MKRTFFIFFALIMLLTMTLYYGTAIKAQETPSVEVAEAAICRDVVDREPIDVGDSFEASVGRLYCFTKITGVENPIEITHVWNFGETERARINLPVESSGWRTWSSKIIQPHEIGDWYVDVLGPDDEVLETLEFKITE